MGSKAAPQKMQFLGAIKKVASLGAFINAKMAGNPQRFGRHRSKIGPNPNVLAYSKSSRTGANMNMWVYEWNMPREKVLAFLKSLPCSKKNWRMTVSVFLSTLQITALLLKSFRLRLHCYTLATAFLSLDLKDRQIESSRSAFQSFLKDRQIERQKSRATAFLSLDLSVFLSIWWIS